MPPVNTRARPVEPRPATSVLLLRTGPGARLEIFTLLRVTTMAFAGGFTAYPGGAVDPSDRDLPDAWVGPEKSWWSARLQLRDPMPWVICAARELFEEVGVALVRGERRDRAEREDLRGDLAAHRTSMASGCTALGWTLDLSGVRPWARWITPPESPRRYDTMFFVAALPDAEEAVLATTEADIGMWTTPADLLARFHRAEIEMMPPTVAMAEDLAGCADLEAVLGQDRTVTAVQARIVSGPGESLRVEVDPVREERA